MKLIGPTPLAMLVLGFATPVFATMTKQKPLPPPRPKLVPTLGKPPLLLWNTLALKDSAKASDQKKVQEVQGKTYRIPGYMVPLEADQKFAVEFLFVPSLPSCIHVPPPPPSQTIHVKMKAGEKAPISWDPIFIEGQLKVREGKQKDYGEASFTMDAGSVRVLKEEDMNEISKILPQDTYVPDCNGRDKYEPVCKAGGGKAPGGGKKAEKK